MSNLSAFLLLVMPLHIFGAASDSLDSYDKIETAYVNFFSAAEKSLNYSVSGKEFMANELQQILEFEDYQICFKGIDGEEDYDKHQKRCSRRFSVFYDKDKSCSIVELVDKKHIACGMVDQDIQDVFKRSSQNTMELSAELSSADDESLALLKDGVFSYYGESAQDVSVQSRIKTEFQFFNTVTLFIRLNFFTNTVIAEDYIGVLSDFLGKLSCATKTIGILQSCILKEGIDFYRDLANSYSTVRDQSVQHLSDAKKISIERIERTYR
jgi:hypothetical protein